MSAHQTILTRGRRAVCASALAVLGLSLGTGPLSPAAAQTTPTPTPPAASKGHVDMRSEHYRLRRKCTLAAEAQGLSGDALKLQVQKCLSGK
jgi:hypothetical protein